MKKLSYLILLIGLNITIFAQDSHVCNMIEKTLDYMDIKVQDVRIADGRAKGGIRMLIITYKANSTRDKQAVELTNVLESGIVANDKLDGNIDETSAVIADNFGNTLAIVNTTVSATRTFQRRKDAENYVKSWNVMRVDKSFLSSLLSMSKQN